MTRHPLLDNPISLCTPARVLCAEGARRRIAPLCASRGWQRALLVTDQWFVQHSAELREVIEMLRAHGIDTLVFDGGVPDPSTTLCDSATQGVLERCGERPVDHVIAWGGGSNIDLAKALSLTVPWRCPVGDLVGHTNWPGRPLPLVAVPTTAGTGSEITPGAILVQPGSATKVALMANDLRPAIAVVDAELTWSCPPGVTADAGADALTHAIESWLTLDAAAFDAEADADPAYSGRNDITVMFAREAVALCFRHLVTAWSRPGDRRARAGMARASLYAALSYATAGLHAVHGLAYALAGLTHATHGSTNAVLLPYVMDSLVEVRTTELAEIARIAGARGADDVALARQAPLLTRRLLAGVGLSTELPAFGVAKEQLPLLVSGGLAVRRLAKAYPGGPLEAAYASIVDNAFQGRLSGDMHR